METHLENWITVLFAAIVLTFMIWKFYRNGAYSKTGMYVGWIGLWVPALFMLFYLSPKWPW